MRFKKAPIFLLLIILLNLSGCGVFKDEEDRTKNWSAQKFYAEATDAMDSSDYQTAIKWYEKLEARYPFGKYATQSQLDIIYAYYKYSEPDSAIAAANRFIRLHPNDPNAAYAWYLKGLANFNRSLGFLSRFIPTDATQRDPGASRDSFTDFKELVRRYPNTKYAEDAQKRLFYLRNNIAQSEVNIAQYYLKKKAYVASARRAKRVLENYQKTPAVKAALKVLIKSYEQLGLTKLAEDSRRVYALNEHSGAFLPEPDPSLRPLGRKIWDAIGLDRN